jgi:antitoxin (DNA-binding transcriptional repressor) of toxin-antitoxin stability system
MSILTVSEEEASNHLGRYLEAVKRGETVVILEGDRPVARIAPIGDARAGVAMVASPRLANREDAADFILTVGPDAAV